MYSFKSLFIFAGVLITAIFISTSTTHAAIFQIQNLCNYTIWAAAVPGGGQRLDSDQIWTLDVSGDTPGRIWARTNCSFNSNGRGSCQTGDCNGFLQCTDYGAPPNTLAEYSLAQFNNLDFIDISLVDGFNVPIEFSRPSTGCNNGISCTADINEQCPDELRAPGGCNNPCTVFKTDEYCCTSGSSCGPTNYSRFFKDRCPDAFSYPLNDQGSVFACPTGSSFRLLFCP